MRGALSPSFTILALAAAGGALGRQSYDWLDASQRIAADFAYPRNAQIAASGNYSLFKSDITGRVDITTVFQGEVEYIFGLFASGNVTTAATDPTSLIPMPVSNTIQQLAIQNNVVSLSTIVGLSYLKQNISLPVQLDAWFAFDEETGQMSQYDVTFRRWSWLMAEALPLLVPDIEKENGIPTGSMTQESLITLHAAKHICAQHAVYCTDPKNVQYTSSDQCLSFLANNRTWGAAWALGQDTTGCRYMHAGMLKYRPDVHCPHIGPSGGGMCTARDYAQTVLQPVFNSTWVAPIAEFPSSLEGISADSQTELVKAGMEAIAPMTIGWYPSVAFCYFVLLWLSALITRIILLRFKVFRDLSWALQRTAVTYVLSTIYTTLALALQAVALPTVWYSYSMRSIDCIRIAGVVVTGLYIFEMIYRENLRLPLLTHHLLTVFAIIWVVFCLDKQRHPSLITTGEVWLFQATLEQVVFIGLFSYRMKWPKGVTNFCLTIGAAVSLVLKLAAAAWLLVIWGTKQRTYNQPTDIAFSVIIWIIVPCLLLAQVWGAWVCWSLAKSIKTGRRGRDREEGAAATIGSAAGSREMLGKMMSEKTKEDLTDGLGGLGTVSYTPYTPSTLDESHGREMFAAASGSASAVYVPYTPSILEEDHGKDMFAGSVAPGPYSPSILEEGHGKEMFSEGGAGARS